MNENIEKRGGGALSNLAGKAVAVGILAIAAVVLFKAVAAIIWTVVAIVAVIAVIWALNWLL
jgi:hypothetical protein